MSVNKESFKIIGVIGKPHGIKGYVYVRFFTDYPDSIIKESKLYLDDTGSQEVKIEEILNITVKRGVRTAYKFYGFNSRNDAENIRGKSLHRKLSDKPELNDGTYWIDDLAGCSVHTSDNVFIGYVEDIENHPSIDILIIKITGLSIEKYDSQNITELTDRAGKKNKKNEEYIIKVPMVDDYIVKIDIENRKIIISKLPEYI